MNATLQEQFRTWCERTKRERYISGPAAIFGSPDDTVPAVELQLASEVRSAFAYAYDLRQKEVDTWKQRVHDLQVVLQTKQSITINIENHSWFSRLFKKHDRT